ncbi:cytochrome P450 [Flagelloscypha sp. PMI_526]|nr:cytochrome P450 [Flagelloscypha sp. PMI_526]
MLSLTTSNILLNSFLAGPAFHASIHLLNLDIDGWPWTTVLFTCFSFFYLLPLWLQTTLSETALSFGSFNLGLWTSIAVYRVLLHPLRRFNGPTAAHISSWWGVRQVVKTKFRWYKEVQGMHRVWGDFVRTGKFCPNELSINHADAIPLIYGPQSKCTKGPWYTRVSKDPALLSLHTTQDVEDHRLRRKAWDRGLGASGLNTLTPRTGGWTLLLSTDCIINKTNLLVSQLRSQAKQNGGIVDITEWINLYSFVVMGDIGLGKDFPSFETQSAEEALTGLHKGLRLIGLLSFVPWFTRMILPLFYELSKFNAFHEFSKRELVKKEANVDKINEPADVLSWILKAKYDEDKTAALGTRAMHADAALIVVAGSDTIATTAINALYNLATHPHILAKLRNQLQSIFPSHTSEDWSYSEVKDIPYLEGVINEALRLHPAIPGGLSRVTPREGLTIGGTWIPGNTVVSVPTYTIQRDERYWDEPLEFKPERWENEGTAVDMSRDAFMPFGRGPWVCVGKAMARMELRMVLARIVLNFDLVIDKEDEATKMFEERKQEWFVIIDPRLPLKLVPL